jgi:1-acyl-sn-glycerol-3-phosphate acyltransferase
MITVPSVFLDHSSNRGAIWLDRTKADFSAFRQAVDLIKQGKVLGIAPEGTRSRVGELLEVNRVCCCWQPARGVPIVRWASRNRIGMKKMLRCTGRKSRWVRQAFNLPPLSRENRDEPCGPHHRGDVPDRRAAAGKIPGVL